MNLGGNSIKYIENVERMNKLQTLEIYQNKLTDISNITLFPKKVLRRVNASYNLLPLEGMDQLLMCLEKMKCLRDLDLSGNELALHKYYRINIYEHKNIKKLDNIQVQDFLRDYMNVI